MMRFTPLDRRALERELQKSEALSHNGFFTGGVTQLSVRLGKPQPRPRRRPLVLVPRLTRRVPAAHDRDPRCLCHHWIPMHRGGKGCKVPGCGCLEPRPAKGARDGQ